MPILEVIKVIDAALPDEQIIKNVTNLLQEYAKNGEVEIELDEAEAKNILVPADTEILIVTKAFLKEYFEINFQTGYRVMVALGGIREEKHGLLQAKFCFATLYCDAEGNMVTIDFHLEMR
ncbi:MAG: hypothetical protein SAJ37_20100 [Oscillatoria sp. PMC 1068.18]|nr:hypothetical protein [Oscillatoria sp. PMC 1076.18]MEC4991043.1 hypothetical protein [Oscillatoria sp. PMC 1068.18]